MMKSVFDEYHPLWPKDSHAQLKPILSQVPVLHFPEQKAHLTKVLPGHVLVVLQKASLSEIFSLLELGFEHCIQESRPDFPQELLATSLMLAKAKSFQKNPIPFFFSGFQGDDAKNPDKNLTMQFHKSSEKALLLDWLSMFLQQNPQTSSIIDLCLQSADEMITNALFNAPVRPSGKRPFQTLPRDAELEMPITQKATLFTCFSQQRVIVGCSDVFGSLGREGLLQNLRAAFREKSVTAREGQGRVGLGFRFLIENSANFYVMVNKNQSTLVACGYLLKGLNANVTAQKHFHFMFR